MAGLLSVLSRLSGDWSSTSDVRARVIRTPRDFIEKLCVLIFTFDLGTAILKWFYKSFFVFIRIDSAEELAIAFFGGFLPIIVSEIMTHFRRNITFC